VVSPSTLADAHTAVLRGASYVVDSERTVRDDAGDLVSSLRVSVALAADRTYRATLSTAGPAGPAVLGQPPATATFWSDGERYLRRFTRDEETIYNSFQPPDEYVGTWYYWVRTVPFGGGYGGPERFYRDVFADVATDVADRFREGDHARVRLANEGDAPRTSTPAFALDVADVAAVDLSAIVDERGFIPSMHLDHTGSLSVESVEATREVAVEWTVHYRGLGATTVDRPPWYDRAVEE
jgi:hypothetical protein